jgi:PD-(D/E)XK nuclease superfamily protein
MQKWNYSLDLIARVCQRKAFLTARYACHSSAKGTPRHEAFLLKKAVDPENWRGLLVHTVIHEKIAPALKQSRWPNFNEARDFASSLLDRQLAFSKAGLYRSTPKTKAENDYCILYADLRGEGLTAPEIARVKAEVLHSLNTLETCHQELLKRAVRAKWVLSEEEIRFRLDNKILVEAKPDLLFCEQGDGLVIIDWKAVESPNRNARSQLHNYAFAVLQCSRWPRLRVNNLELIEANLLSGDSSHFPVTEEDLDLIDDRIFTGAELLSSIFERPADDCRREDFAPTDSPNACTFCNVLEVCNGQALSQNNRL